MKTRRMIFTIITLAWVALIFSFSLQPGEVSSDVSGSFGRKLLELFLPGVFEQLEMMPEEQLEFWHLILRKCAHFTEYLILGVLGTVTLLQTKLRYRGIAGIGFCVAVAAVDETIQVFVDGRAGRIADVLLDGAGAAVGIVLVFGVCVMRKNDEDSIER